MREYHCCLALDPEPVLIRRLLLLLALIVSACGPLFPGGDDVQRVTLEHKRVLEAVGPDLEAAQSALATERWVDAAAAYARALEKLPDESLWGGMRDQCQYNRACALAREGTDLDGAVQAFTASVAEGLREVMQPGPDGWVSAPGLSLVHLLADRDLDRIRGRADFQRALDATLRTESVHPVVEDTRGGDTSHVVVLLPATRPVEPFIEEWRAAAQGLGHAVSVVTGPVRERPGDARWVLEDGDTRWGVQALERVLEGGLAGRRNLVLVTVSEGAGAVAWEAAMAHADRVAAVALPGGRFHAAFHADRLALVRPEWRVVLGSDAADDAAAEMLSGHGAEVLRIEARKNRPELPARLLSALFGQTSVDDESK